MFFVKLALTGILVGIIGYFVLERFLRRFLSDLPLGKQLLAVAILGILFLIATMSIFISFLSDMTQMSAIWIWAIMIPSILSVPTIIILIAVFYKILLGGYSEFVNIANEVLTPIIAGTIGFLFGFIQPQQGNQIYFEPELIAVVNFFLGFIGGGISAFIDYLTKKVLKSFLSQFD